MEGLYDVLIKKLTGAMHNLLSSLPLWPLGQFRLEQCLLSQIVTERRERGREGEVAVGLAGGDEDGEVPDVREVTPLMSCRHDNGCFKMTKPTFISAPGPLVLARKPSLLTGNQQTQPAFTGFT